jgi:D-proline reductase (dithiol) PrdB
VALFTTGAIHKKNQPGWISEGQTYDEAVRDVRAALERFPSLRLIERDTPVSELIVSHIAFDISAAQRDINVIFPLERFQELAVEGYIRQLAPLNYSMQGLTNLQRLEQEYAPRWAAEIKAAGIDAVFLTPG